MKKVLCFLFSLFIFITNIYAEEYISSVNMDIKVDSEGTANITEVWDVRLETGTELYKTFNELNSSRITDFQVYLNGQLFENINTWDMYQSFEGKSYKSGLNYINDGVELCWGISIYGNNTYTIKYKINNFVERLTDADVIYYRIMPPNMDPPVNKFHAVISTYYSLNESNSQIWAYGFDGFIVFENGNIVIDSDTSLDSSEYVVPLVKLEQGKFNTDAYRQESFDDILGISKKGTFNLDNFKHTNFYKKFITILQVLFVLCLFLYRITIPLFLSLFISLISTIFTLLSRWLGHGAFLNSELPKHNYIREFKDPDVLLAAGYCYGKEYIYNEGNLINACLLKMYNDNLITITGEGKDSIIDITKLVETNKVTLSDAMNGRVKKDIVGLRTPVTTEKKIITPTQLGLNERNIQNAVALGLLEAKETSSLSKTTMTSLAGEKEVNTANNSENPQLLDSGSNNSSLIIMFTPILIGASTDNKVSVSKLSNYCKKNRNEIKDCLQSYYHTCRRKVKENPTLENDLFGLVRYLKDFSVMDDKDIPEVRLWNDYLVLATAFGFADNINEKLQNKNLIYFNKLEFNFSYLSDSRYIFKDKYRWSYYSISHIFSLMRGSGGSDRGFSSGGGGRSFSGGGNHSSGGGSHGGGGGRR